jgi:acetate kinase
MQIFVLNAGSSSQKSRLYEIPTNTFPRQVIQPIWSGQINWHHDNQEVEIAIKTLAGEVWRENISSDSRESHINHMLHALTHGPTKVIDHLSQIDVVGHRVVHGGEKYQDAVMIDQSVKQAIAKLSEIAPAHNPSALEGIEAIEKKLGKIPQVAVFDTGFHRTLPAAAAIYPLPYELVAQGIRRYGFHGISHQYCAGRAAEILHKDLAELRLINCHLGNGASLAAIKHGCSIDTTMGFTPLEGLMMGSRSGSIDPGILIYLLQHLDYSPEQLDNMLNKASGLLGVSGLSSDLRDTIQAIGKGNDRAQLAWDIYVHRLCAAIGAMLASLRGLDVLVFTGGVGENSAGIRQAVCEAWEFLGLRLDLEKNQQQPIDQDIATLDSTIRVLVVKTEEDWAIAQNCWQLVAGVGS